MNQRTKTLSFLSTLCVSMMLPAFPANDARAQSRFEVTIQQFSPDEVRGYIQPLGDKFGANMNAGFYHSAGIPDEGFHIRFDMVAMMSMVQDEDRTYDAKLPAGFVPASGSYKTSTVFGGKGTTFKDAKSGLEYKGSDGVFSTNVFPLFVPQVSIGTAFGTEATVRYISTPPLASGKLPSSTLWGIGVRHSVSRYFGEDPAFDASVAFFYSKFRVGDVIAIQGSAVDLQVSKSFLLFTVYGGCAVENSSMSVHYGYKSTDTSTPTLVDLTIRGENAFRFTTGLQIDLQAIRVFADANFGYVQHFTGGIGFGF